MTRAASWAHAGELLYLLELKVRHKKKANLPRAILDGICLDLDRVAHSGSIDHVIAQYTACGSARGPGEEPAGR